MSNVIGIFKRHHWDIGLIYRNDGDKILDPEDIHVIKNPYHRTTWFADPFILDVTDDYIYLLVEEFTYSVNKGRIAKLTIDRKKDEIVGCKIILDSDTHLSFPAILRYDGKVYIYPENSASGESCIYKYENDELKLVSVLASRPLTDAVIEVALKRPVMLSTKIPAPNGNELGIYVSDNLLGKYRPAHIIRFQDNVARNAGEIFEREGVMIRPAQICQGEFGYGLGICFQKVEESELGISLEEICRVYPPKEYDGMHTFNQYKGVGVVDLRKYNYPFIHSVLSGIKDIVR